MSPMRSRRKGRRFEQDIADSYRQKWPGATVRRSSQGDGAHEPDVVIEADAPDPVYRLWTECQHAVNPTPFAKLAQAERDLLAASPAAPGSSAWIPIVVWHKTGARSTQVTTRLWTFASLGIMPLLPDDLHALRLVVTVDFDEFLALLP